MVYSLESLILSFLYLFSTPQMPSKGLALFASLVLQSTWRSQHKIEDKVWLSTEHLNVSEAQKFKEKFIGSYMVLDTPPNVVRLHLSSQIQIHPTVNIEQVKPYHEPVPRQCVHPPGLQIVTDEGQEE